MSFSDRSAKFKGCGTPTDGDMICTVKVVGPLSEREAASAEVEAITIYLTQGSLVTDVAE